MLFISVLVCDPGNRDCWKKDNTCHADMVFYPFAVVRDNKTKPPSSSGNRCTVHLNPSIKSHRHIDIAYADFVGFAFLHCTGGRAALDIGYCEGG